MREQPPEAPVDEFEDEDLEPEFDEQAEDADHELPAEAAGPNRTPRRLRRWLQSNSWLVIAAGAAMVLTRVVEFSPPDQVRIDDTTVDMVGEAPNQDFSDQLGNPQAVQLRATLRLYPRTTTEVHEPDPEIDAKAQILSQPVVTTIYAMNATIDQSVSLGGGKFQINVSFDGTPRLADAPKGEVPGLELEHELTVTSTESRWLGDPEQRMHLHTRGSLTDLEDRPHRWVFVIEDKLFALDLELHRAV